jgi:predicted amidohydrolase YtcJ
VDAYTLESALVTGEGDRKGRIKPGYLADFVLLDRDLFAVPDEEITEAKVLLTMVGGEKAFSTI